jgi:hypothetical protein
MWFETPQGNVSSQKAYVEWDIHSFNLSINTVIWSTSVFPEYKIVLLVYEN